MRRLFLMASCLLATTLMAQAQAPGVDPRGVMTYSAPVVIGIVEEPWQRVIRPDKLSRGGAVKQQPNGTYTVEIPQMSSDYLVGYIFRVRVQEVLKPDRRVRIGQTIEVFAPFSLESGVSLPPKQRFLLALAHFSPKKEDFEKTKVLKVGQSLFEQGIAFNLNARYYLVASDSNGAVAITDKNRKLIQEIRAAILAH